MTVSFSDYANEICFVPNSGYFNGYDGEMYLLLGDCMNCAPSVDGLQLGECCVSEDIDICLQKARQFTKQDFQDFDMIYAMDNSNYRDIIALATTEDEKNKVKLILNETSPGEHKDVPDPYHDTQKGFENVFNMLNEACEVIAKRLT